MDVPSINGCVYAYYFRSRKGGAAIVKGARKKSDFPHVLEQVILEVRNKRNFNPKVLMCDNAGEFISDLAMAMYDTLAFDKRSAVDKRIHKVGGEATGSTV